MTQKLRMPHELRPAYYPRIAQKYREMDLEDPDVCEKAATMALEELEKLKALDAMFIFYRGQAQMLSDYAGLVRSKARLMDVDPPAAAVSKLTIAVVALVAISVPTLWGIWSSIGSSMSYALQ